MHARALMGLLGGDEDGVRRMHRVEGLAYSEIDAWNADAQNQRVEVAPSATTTNAASAKSTVKAAMKWRVITETYGRGE